MAYVGLAKPIIAKLTETGGVATYSAGFAFGKAISLDIAPEYNEASLYGDNQQVETEKEFKQATVTLGTTTIPTQAYSVMFGHEVKNEAAGAEIIYKTDDASNYVGFGCYTDETIEGVKKFVAMWIHKVKFTQSQESYKTKGDSIEFQTPSITGVAIGTDTKNWKTTKIFATQEAAITWLNEKAQIA